MLDLLALEDDVFQRYLSAQPAASALQRSNRGRCAHLLRELAATADLPPRNALFSQQLLDLTHRWWSETYSPDTDEGDVHPLAAAAYICIKLHSARHPDPAPFHLPDPPGSRLTDLLTTLAAFFWARTNLLTCRLCTRLMLCMKLWPKNIAWPCVLPVDYVRDRPLSLESTPSRIRNSAWFLSCVV